MKELLKIQGGYPRQMDYLITLQNELYATSNSLFAGIGMDLALSGCEVTDHGNGSISIAPGIVFVGGEVIRFDGTANLSNYTTKTLIKGPYVPSDPKIFADQQSKNVYREARAVLSEKSSVLQLQIKNTNLYHIKDYISDTVSAADVKGAIRQIYDLEGNFLNNFDGSGLGISARYNGWALMNGQNGTPDACGKAFITAGKYTDRNTGLVTNYRLGDTGGSISHTLTISEIPAHDHVMPQVHQGQEYSADGGKTRNSKDASNPRTGMTGGGLAHNNMQPYLSIYSIIKIA